MKINTFITEFQKSIPLALAMPDDPVGMQVFPEERTLEAIAVGYELNEDLVEVAVGRNAQLVIAFHPLIYPSLRQVTQHSRVERTVMKLIRENISLYILHTAFDAHPRGTSRLLAERLGLQNISAILPSPVMEEAGMGAIGSLETTMPLEQVARLVKDACDAELVRVSCPAGDAPDYPVQRIGILAGSGMSFYGDAIAAGADAFVTADAKYHNFHAANDDIPIIDPGHAESESLVIEGMAALVNETIQSTNADIRIEKLEQSTNPVRYFV